MQVNVRFLENMKLEASFDDFKIMTDQPVRYKGDGQAPSPFDYFLASSALCAAYFVKIYCQSRDIPTNDLKISQNNIVDPENRYNQTFNIEIELPPGISEKDKAGILAAMERCSVKRVIQNSPAFQITATEDLGATNLITTLMEDASQETMILGKDESLENTIKNMSHLLADLGIKIEIASWRNPIPHVWSVHIRDADSPICYTNGKGATKNAALCSALGEYIERISNNYFYNDYFLGRKIAELDFVHYPQEKWFSIPEDNSIPEGLMDEYLLNIYNPDDELMAHHLIDTNSAHIERGICALPYIRQSDGENIYIPVNLIGNLFVSNGMSAGNNIYEARVQALSEIFERAIKNQIIREEITLPDVPREIIDQFPKIKEGIQKLEEEGFPVLIKDASLGGRFPVMCVTLMNPRTGGVFASFGSHPKFEVALERSLTELLQGRSFEGLNDLPAPTFNKFAVTEHNNIVDHFIDSSGVISWKFFSAQSEYEFIPWDFSGTTQEEYDYLMNILKEIEKEVYIADYTELGAAATRILVPNFSEIYEVSDLIWDNNNRAIHFREDILHIHELNDNQLTALLDKFEEFELDDYLEIIELIGVNFDVSSVWGQLTVGELKALIYLALGDLENAKEFVDMQNTFSELSPSRKKYFQLMSILLDIELNDYDIADYQYNLSRMYGDDLFKLAMNSLKREITFFGLEQTNMHFDNLDKHQRLLESYLKLHKRRNKIYL